MKKTGSSGILLFLGVAILGLLIYLAVRPPAATVIVKDNPVQFSSVRKHPFDVYADPYHAPERKNPYIDKDYTFNQVGVLQGSGTLMPLFGRPSPTIRNKWEYYTMSQGLKMPIEYRNRACGQHGCDEVYSKDDVLIPGLGKFAAMVYDTQDFRYVPRT